MFSLIRTKTQRCTSVLCALFFCGLSRTLHSLHWKIQPGYEYLLILYQRFHESTNGCHFGSFSSMRTKTRRCTPSISALSIWGWITTLQFTLWEIQPGHEIEYFLTFYQISKVYKRRSFLQLFINSNQNTTLHTFNMCSIHV